MRVVSGLVVATLLLGAQSQALANPALLAPDYQAVDSLREVRNRGGGRGGFGSSMRGRTRVGPRIGRSYRPPSAVSRGAVPQARLQRRGSTISDGMGGFTVYRGGERSRYIESPASPGKVYHPDGSGSLVIEDENGNLSVYGPDGVHKVYRDSEGARLTE